MQAPSLALSGPMRVDVLLQDQFSLMCLAAVIEPLRAANRVAALPLYRWRLLSRQGVSALSTSGLSVNVDDVFDPADSRDALFLLGSFNTRMTDRSLRADLRRAARGGAIMAAVEAGSWELARAGLLDGFAATTHWEDLDEFAASFPKIAVRNDRFVMDRKRWTAGGATPALDMMLTLLRQDHGLPLALNVASVFVYDQTLPGSTPQPVVSLGRLLGDDPALARAITLMQRHLEEPLGLTAIAAQSGVLRRTLETRFRAQLGQSPYDYYLDLRLSAAKRMLEQSAMGVAEVATAHGFTSPSSFARAFRRRFQMSPLTARAGMRLAAPPATGRMAG
ncbi:GlxA family transcriptional regulator [Acidisoma cellulosilytica]|uniref:GlxA family transcriptional regulator n=1 Tax=Acidisoma cellulosilyticum TaxID=2802395 RepID=A0A963Z2G4_9PROT|nr:GlxA family transcriptional regulator [Acidisoma cellulosilyticum]MCB8881632.1 GlxA family transcriptional regulator [Acidisoma cellulosilyticum]